MKKFYVTGVKYPNGEIERFSGGHTIKDVEQTIIFHLENSTYFQDELKTDLLADVEKYGYTTFFSSQKGFEGFRIFIVENKKFVR